MAQKTAKFHPKVLNWGPGRRILNPCGKKNQVLTREGFKGKV